MQSRLEIKRQGGNRSNQPFAEEGPSTDPTGLEGAKSRQWKSGNERIASQGRKFLESIEKDPERLKSLRKDADIRDPLEAWFYYLGLPCHPRGVRKEHNPAHPSAATCGEGNGEEDFDSGSDELSDLRDNWLPLHKVVDIKYTATASTITPDQMNTFLRWEFISAKREPPAEVKKPINPYHECYQYNRRRTWAIHDITAPVQCSRCDKTNKPLVLERKITQFLSEEHDRIREGNPKLPYPTTWLAELLSPEPPKYHIPLEYASFVTGHSDYLFMREAKCRSADAQSSSSGRSDRTIVPRKTGLAFKANTTYQGETQEMRNLLAALKSEDTEEGKRKIAITLNKEVQLRNIHWKRHNAVVTLHSTIRRVLQRPDDVIQPLHQEDMESNDLHYADGNTMLHWDTTNHLRFEPYIIEKFLTFPGCPDILPSEGQVEKIVGNLLTDIVVGKGMMERSNAPLPFPKHLKAVGTNPSPDIYVRATLGLNWVWNILPVLFAGECKPIIRYNIWKPRAQLAMAFHGTLISLILYYLDTRDDVDSALPPWLFLYGIEYMEHGVVIHAHYPSYFIDRNRPGGGCWRLQASLVSDHFANVFKEIVDPSARVQLLAVLFRIRSHSLYVLKQLEQWTRGPEVLKVLATELNPTSPEELERIRELKRTKQRTGEWAKDDGSAIGSGVKSCGRKGA